MWLMDYVYVLEHSYENVCGCDEVKMIGVYSTEEKAKETVKRLKYLEGFRDYHIDNFHISKYEINLDHWEDGFFTYYYTE